MNAAQRRRVRALVKFVWRVAIGDERQGVRVDTLNCLKRAFAKAENCVRKQDVIQSTLFTCAMVNSPTGKGESPRGRVMAKHRRKPARKYIKKAATVSGSVATATALTVGMAAPPSNASNYTPLITDSSNSFNNLLFVNGNVGGTAASIWNPLATLIPGGLLPTFTAGTEQMTSRPSKTFSSLGQVLPFRCPT